MMTIVVHVTLQTKLRHQGKNFEVALKMLLFSSAWFHMLVLLKIINTWFHMLILYLCMNVVKRVPLL